METFKYNATRLNLKWVSHPFVVISMIPNEYLVERRASNYDATTGSETINFTTRKKLSKELTSKLELKFPGIILTQNS